jgi:uncharacterized surface protein with fasciclin (FAS1) repeats
MIRSVMFAAAAAVALAAPAFAKDCPGKTQQTAMQTAAPMTGAKLTRIAHPAATRATGDIVDVAAGAGQFRTLLAAAAAAGLVDALKGPGPITVFAPTDAAFAALPKGTVESLLKPENRAQLRQILTYHVVSGRILASDLAGKTAQPTTLAGQTLNVDGRQGVSINNARVITADVLASNGVIHVIDRVLLPR